jgi:hypothetical protein
MISTTATKTYGQYHTEVSPDGTRFEITKFGTTTRHPINWIDGNKDRVGAWQQARCQHLPVVYCDATSSADTNDLMELGVVFDPKTFEQVVYSGYVAYNISMTDGHYAPIDEDSWIRSFREEVREGSWSWNYNDTARSVRPALALYRELLTAALVH